MTPTVYRLQVDSLRRAADHLQLLDLAELEAAAAHQGTDADRRFLAGLRLALPHLPRQP